MNAVTGPESVSPVLRTMHDRLAHDAGLKARYLAAKAVVRAFRTPAFYEISTRCNLFCEGCYYFEASAANRSPADPGLAPEDWDAFFAREAGRSVSMAYFLGAEPALHQDRLRVAARHFRHGNIGTNGTIRIAPDIPFRISISVWGDAQSDRKLRGSNAFAKAVKLYQGDERAIVLFTVSAWNIEAIPTIARICADHGMELTFNFFSQTREFARKMASSAPNDTLYFRNTAPSDSPVLGEADLARAREAIDQAMEDYPETVVFSRAFNRWITGPGPLYTLDEDGVALDCGSRIRGRMKYFSADLEPMALKCCTPDIDCATCRMHSGAWSSKFVPSLADVSTVPAFEDWLEAIETLGRIFLLRSS